jgi:hypothetical protein
MRGILLLIENRVKIKQKDGIILKICYKSLEIPKRLT